MSSYNPTQISGLKWSVRRWKSTPDPPRHPVKIENKNLSKTKIQNPTFTFTNATPAPFRTFHQGTNNEKSNIYMSEEGWSRICLTAGIVT